MDFEPIKLHELCDRIHAGYDEARYALARQVLPAELDTETGRGNHRMLGWPQAMHLAIALRLKQSHLHLSLVTQVVHWAWRQPASNRPYSAPSRQGLPHCSWQAWRDSNLCLGSEPWLLEVGDARSARWIFGSLSCDWQALGSDALTISPFPSPLVSITIDMHAVACAVERRSAPKFDMTSFRHAMPPPGGFLGGHA